jgi:hypothetical protein
VYRTSPATAVALTMAATCGSRPAPGSTASSTSRAVDVIAYVTVVTSPASRCIRRPDRGLRKVQRRCHSVLTMVENTIAARLAARVGRNCAART